MNINGQQTPKILSTTMQQETGILSTRIILTIGLNQVSQRTILLVGNFGWVVQMDKNCGLCSHGNLDKKGKGKNKRRVDMSAE